MAQKVIPPLLYYITYMDAHKLKILATRLLLGKANITLGGGVEGKDSIFIARITPKCFGDTSSVLPLHVHVMPCWVCYMVPCWVCSIQQSIVITPLWKSNSKTTSSEVCGQ